MGVYVFKSKHGEFMKIGHYAKLNAWSRVAHRGFNSCICPTELTNRVMVSDLELLRWFPDLKKTDEKMLHKQCNQFSKGGEWFSMEALVKVDEIMSVRQLVDCSMTCSLEAALRTRRRL